MKSTKLLAGLCVTSAVLLATPASPAFASAPEPTSHFTFDGNASDSYAVSTATLAPACPAVGTGICNDTTTYSTDDNGGYLEWTTADPYGGGFTLATNGDIGTSYTFGMTFILQTPSIDIEGPYSKIVDYRDRGPDTGFYLTGEPDALVLNYYDLGESTETFAVGDILDIIAVRDSTGVTPTFTVYVRTGGNWIEAFTIEDPSGESDPAEYLGNSILGFFHDDTDTSEEGPQAARIYDLRVWQNTALSLDQIKAAYGSGESPELANTGVDALALVAMAGLMLVGGVGVRRLVRR